MNYLLDLAFIKYTPTGIAGGGKDYFGRDIPYSIAGFIMTDERTNAQKQVSFREIPPEFLEKPYQLTETKGPYFTTYSYSFLDEKNPHKGQSFQMLGVRSSEDLLLESKYTGAYYLKKWAEELVDDVKKQYSQITLSTLTTYENFIAIDYGKIEKALYELRTIFDASTAAERLDIISANISSNGFNPRANNLTLPKFRQSDILEQELVKRDRTLSLVNSFSLLDYFIFNRYPDHKEAFTYEWSKRHPPSSSNSFGNILGTLGAIAMPAVFAHKFAAENPEVTAKLFMPTAVTEFAIEHPVESAAFVAIAMTAGAAGSALASLPSAEVATAAVGTALMDEGKGFLVDQGKKQIQQLINGNQPVGTIQTETASLPVQTKNNSSNLIITLAAAAIAGVAALVVV